MRKRRPTDHPVLWSIGLVGNFISMLTNWHGVWWLWMILGGFSAYMLLEWYERVRDDQ